MKTVFHRIVSVAMSLLLLASTTSWMVDKHFCMGHVVDIAFFADAESCGMMMGDEAEAMEMECCTDEVIAVDGQDDLRLSFDELAFKTQVFITSYVFSYAALFQPIEQQVVPHDGYPPPQLFGDIYLLNEVFLI